DGFFVPGIEDDADIRAVVDRVDLPLQVLFIPGKTESARIRRLDFDPPSPDSLPLRMALQATLARPRAVPGDDVDRSVPSYGDVRRLVRGWTGPRARAAGPPGPPRETGAGRALRGGPLGRGPAVRDADPEHAHLERQRLVVADERDELRHRGAAQRRRGLG